MKRPDLDPFVRRVGQTLARCGLAAAPGSASRQATARPPRQGGRWHGLPAREPWAGRPPRRKAGLATERCPCHLIGSAGAAPGAASLPVIAATSGGADSVAMLLALADLVRAGAVRLDLIVAHLHHGLRGAEADADQQFVAELAARLDLPFETARAEIRTEAEAAGVGLEEAGRAARQRFLADVAGRRGARTVALGHTADDRAETVLFNILRGTGIEGLAAMPPRAVLPSPLMGEGGRRRQPGKGEDPLAPVPSPAEGRGEQSIEIIRPLIDVTRTEVLEFLRRRGQPWREDASNASDAHTRNRLRREVLPLVREAVNPKAGEALARLADQAAAAADVLADAVEGTWQRIARETPDGDSPLFPAVGKKGTVPFSAKAVLLDADDLAALRPWMQGAVLRRAVERLGGGLKHMGADRTAEAVAALLSRPDAGPVELPGNLVATRRGRAIRIGPRGISD